MECKKPQTITELIAKLEQIRAKNGDLKVEEVEDLSKFVEDYLENAQKTNAYIQVGSVVQISPEKESKFKACFLLVTECFDWGVQGFVAIPTADGVGEAYYRARWDEISFIGQAAWVLDETEDP